MNLEEQIYFFCLEVRMRLSAEGQDLLVWIGQLKASFTNKDDSDIIYMLSFFFQTHWTYYFFCGYF